MSKDPKGRIPPKDLSNKRSSSSLKVREALEDSLNADTTKIPKRPKPFLEASAKKHPSSKKIRIPSIINAPDTKKGYNLSRSEAKPEKAPSKSTKAKSDQTPVNHQPSSYPFDPSHSGKKSNIAKPSTSHVPKELLEGLPREVVENMVEVTGSFTGFEDLLKLKPGETEATKEPGNPDTSVNASSQEKPPSEESTAAPLPKSGMSQSVKLVLNRGEFTGSFTGMEQGLISQGMPSVPEEKGNWENAFEGLDDLLAEETEVEDSFELETFVSKPSEDVLAELQHEEQSSEAPETIVSHYRDDPSIPSKEEILQVADSSEVDNAPTEEVSILEALESHSIEALWVESPSKSMPKVSLKPSMTPTARNIAVPAIRSRLLQVSKELPLNDTVEPNDSLLGMVVLNYQIQALIAEGGMGEVYLAEHISIGRPAAVKVLKSQYCRDESMVQRFYQEGRLVNQIQHENVIDVFDFGQLESGRLFYIMELLEGETLANRLLRKPLSFSEALPLMIQGAEALKAVHEKGIIHRDVKPDNFWLLENEKDDKKQLKLLDFGIAKIVGAEFSQKRITRTSAILGTPHYMSPEQLENKTPDLRSDIYSLGVVFYEMFTGGTPFENESIAHVIMMHAQGKIPPLSPEVCQERNIPESLRLVIARATALSSKDRHQSMSELLEDLQAVSLGNSVSSRTLSYWARAKKIREQGHSLFQNRIWHWAVGALLFLGLLVGVFWYAYESGEASQKEQALVVESLPSQTKPVSKPSLFLDAQKRIELREKALAGLRQHLLAGDTSVQPAAAYGIGVVGDQESHSTLEGMLAGGKKPSIVKVAAATSLALLANRASQSVLEQALAKAKEVKEDEKEDKVIIALYNALARLGKSSSIREIAGFGRAKDNEIRLFAGLKLAELGEVRQALFTLSRVDVKGLSSEQQFTLLKERARLGDIDALDILKEGLDTEKKSDRLSSASVLAQLGYDLGRDYLLELLSSPDESERVQASIALLYLGDFSGVSQLKEGLENSSASLRRQSAEGLGILGDESVASLLVKLLKDEDLLVQVSTQVALLSILGLEPELLASAGSSWIAQAMEQKDEKLRLRAIKLLKTLPAKEAVPLLTLALQDNNTTIQKTALALLANFAKEAEKTPDTWREIQRLSEAKGSVGILARGILVAQGDEQAKETFEEDILRGNIDQRLAVVEVALAAGQTSILLDSLEDNSFDVRFRAATLLAENGDKAGKEILQEGLKRRNKELRTVAAKSLYQIGEKIELDKVNPKALLASSDPEVRAEGVLLSAFLDEESSKASLRKAIYDIDPNVRLAAVEAAAVKNEAHLLRLLLRDKNREVRVAAKLALAAYQKSQRRKKQSSQGSSDMVQPEIPLEKVKIESSTTQAVLENQPSPLSQEKNVKLLGEAKLKMSQADATLANGRPAEALRFYRQAQMVVKQPDIKWHYGECYRRMGYGAKENVKKVEYWELAKSAYTSFAKSRPSDLRAEKAKRFAKELEEKIHEIEKS